MLYFGVWNTDVYRIDSAPLQPGFVSAQEYVHRLVKPSVDHVCRLKFATGNYPPCVGDERDLLVHWCHGSPGVIYMLLQAYRVSVRECGVTRPACGQF